MAFLLRTYALIHIVTKRLLAQWGLALVTILGLVASISLVLSIPLYSDAVYHRIFLENVAKQTSQSEQTEEAGGLPFTFLLNYYGGWSGKIQWEDAQPLDQYMLTSLASVLGMPVELLVRYFRTDNAPLYPITATESDYRDPNAVLNWVSFATMSNIEQHITITDGKFPSASSVDKTDPVEVLISAPFANKLGMQIGEQYQLIFTSETASGKKQVTPFSVLISGVWEPNDPNDPYWMFSTGFLIDVFMVPEETFVDRISTGLPDEVYSANWYLMMDGKDVHSDQVGELLGRINRFQIQTTTLLPKVIMFKSPSDALVEFQRAARMLTILLYAFNIPIIGLILAFISLVATLAIERKRNEIAVTRSRGAATLQVLGSIALESVILSIIALAISIPVSILITRVIGQTRSFMEFSSSPSLRVGLSLAALQIGLVAIVIALLASIYPAVNAVRHTIVSYKLDRARSIRPPFWQRAFLDFILLIPAGYGAYLLKKQGSVVLISTTNAGDPFSNPLLFLVPSLVVLALTLIFLRLVRPILAGIAWLATRLRIVGLLLAARQLSRSPGYYNTPLLILVFTLSLSAYTASLSETLNQHLQTQWYYKVGADMIFLDVGETTPQSPFPVQNQVVEIGQPQFFFFPVTEYLQLPSVRAVARIGSYSATATVSQSSSIKARYYGIDRIDLPKAIYWRRDFASASLGALMNALGTSAEGILVPWSFMAERGLQDGDTIKLDVDIGSTRISLDTIIVGSFNLFPTWYPQAGPLFVGNLDYLYERAGGEFPYKVLVRTAPGTDYNKLGELELRGLNVRVATWDAAPLHIQDVQARPEHQGVFGYLFIGFAAAAILTVVAFFLYALFSYQRRFIELGILRAGGLSRGQMATYLAFELLSLIFFGGAVGTALGAGISSYFIPFLQIGSDAVSKIPPFKIIIAWPAIFQIYILFGALFTITLTFLVILLQRMKIFQAIKLGETV